MALRETPLATPVELATVGVPLGRPLGRKGAISHGGQLLPGEHPNLLVTHDQLSRHSPTESTREPLSIVPTWAGMPTGPARRRRNYSALQSAIDANVKDKELREGDDA
ncbi:hypothetical protein ACQPZJ_31750 [Actinoplanes sp. CA-054009]